MSQPTARRCAAVLVFVTASFLLPISSAQAAPRGGRGEAGFLAHVELRNVAASVWNALTSLFEKVGARMDDNG